MARLVVYVPGINMTTDAWQTLISRLKDDLGHRSEFSDTEWVGWNHNCGFWSLKRAANVAGDLKDWLDSKYHASGGRYDDIVLMGHSMGGLFLRQAYLLARGTKIGEPQSPWASRVSKFVLLAGINRGLNTNRFRVRIYDRITRFLGWCLRRRPLAQDLMSGSDFITDLRLRWIRLFRKLSPEDRPTIIQILGKRDDVVSREDSIDLEQFPNAYHLPVPEASHKDLPVLARGANPEARFETIRDALTGENLGRADAPLSYAKSDKVIFILHGIRAANRGWVSQLASKIESNPVLADSEVIPSSYGYLSALEFALPFLHRRCIRWFKNKYSDYFVTNPGAEFHFVGHSNGTYVLGESLRALSGMRFRRVALAGSVLPRDFPWRETMKLGQVAELRNDQSNEDFPVGFLCSGLRGLGIHDIGVAGFEGFNDDDNHIVQFAFHEGGHGAALESQNLDSIVDFLAHGVRMGRLELRGEEKQWFGLLSRAAPWLFRILVLAAAIALVGAAIAGRWDIAIGLLAVIVLASLGLKIL